MTSLTTKRKPQNKKCFFNCRREDLQSLLMVWATL